MNQTATTKQLMAYLAFYKKALARTLNRNAKKMYERVIHKIEETMLTGMWVDEQGNLISLY